MGSVYARCSHRSNRGTGAWAGCHGTPYYVGGLRLLGFTPTLCSHHTSLWNLDVWPQPILEILIDLSID
jgi:hypothetical protein